MKVPYFRDDSLTIEALVDGEKVVEVIRFKERVTASEMENVRRAWEAGFARGLAHAQSQESKPS